MFEQLFTNPAVVTRHREAPYARSVNTTSSIVRSRAISRTREVRGEITDEANRLLGHF
jgi:hypothetical protein